MFQQLTSSLTASHRLLRHSLAATLLNRGHVESLLEHCTTHMDLVFRVTLRLLMACRSRSSGDVVGRCSMKDSRTERSGPHDWVIERAVIETPKAILPPYRKPPRQM